MDLKNNKITAEQYFICNPFWAKAIFLDNENMGSYSDSIDVLPENIKDLIYSVETAEIIDSIGKKYNLNIWKMNKMAIKTGEIISAEIPIAQFIPNITRELDLPAETSRAIAQEINIKIFSKAALQIRKLHESKFPALKNNGYEKSGHLNSQEDRNIETKKQRNFLPSITPQVRKPEERIVNLQKRIDEKPKFIEPGPKVEGNIVDLSQ